MRSVRTDIDMHEVRLDLLEINRHVGLSQAFCETARSRMIVSDALNVVVHGIDSSSSDDARLSHGTTEEVFRAPRLKDLGLGTGERCAKRTPETLVCHRRRWQKYSRFLAENDGAALLELQNRGALPQLLVAETSGCNRGSHRRRGLRDRVRP
jgi:hypothetical protein